MQAKNGRNVICERTTHVFVVVECWICLQFWSPSCSFFGSIEHNEQAEFCVLRGLGAEGCGQEGAQSV